MSGEENIDDVACKREPEEEQAAPSEAAESVQEVEVVSNAGEEETADETTGEEEAGDNTQEPETAPADDADVSVKEAEDEADSAPQEAPVDTEAAAEPMDTDEPEETAEAEADAPDDDGGFEVEDAPEPDGDEQPAEADDEECGDVEEAAESDADAEKRPAEEAADEADEQDEGEAQQQEAEPADDAGVPEGPEFFETDFEQLKIESEAPFAKANGSNYFHTLSEKFLGKVSDQYKNKSNYKIFYSKVANVQDAVNDIYGFDWNAEKNAKVLHSNQGFAYVAKPEFPSYREASLDEMKAIIASRGADNVTINGSNYFHTLEKKFREAVNNAFGKESQAFIAWFHKTDNAEAAVNELYGRSWNEDENAKILHRSQGFAFVIQRVEEEE